MTATSRRRALSAVTVTTAGLAVALATWLSGRNAAALALVALAVVGGLAVHRWSAAGSDVGALLGGTGDERQRTLDLSATAFAGLAMGAFSTVMALIAIARDQTNPWVVVCAVGALAYVVALTVLRLRR